MVSVIRHPSNVIPYPNNKNWASIHKMPLWELWDSIPYAKGPRSWGNTPPVHEVNRQVDLWKAVGPVGPAGPCELSLASLRSDQGAPGESRLEQLLTNKGTFVESRFPEEKFQNLDTLDQIRRTAWLCQYHPFSKVEWEREREHLASPAVQGSTKEDSFPSYSI